MEYETLDIFKEGVRNYTVYHGRDIKWLKNDKQKCRAICKDEKCKSMMQKICTFYSSDYLYLSMMLAALCIYVFAIRDLNDSKCLLSDT